MTATLRNTAHREWRFATGITPEPPNYTEPTTASGTLHGGVLTIHASNLQNQAVNGLSHAWPQSAGLFLYAGRDINCASRVYLDADKVQVESPSLQINVQRSGKLRVSDGALRSGGRWNVAVITRSPNGGQRQTKSVKTTTADYVRGDPYALTAELKGLRTLRHFTSLTVAVSKNGKNRVWATITRTP